MTGVVAPFVANDAAPAPAYLAAQRRVSVIMVVYMTGAALGESIACALNDPMVGELVIVAVFTSVAARIISGRRSWKNAGFDDATMRMSK